MDRLGDVFCFIFQGLPGKDGLPGRKGEKGEIGIVGMRGIKVSSVFVYMCMRQCLFILYGFNLEATFRGG